MVAAPSVSFSSCESPLAYNGKGSHGNVNGVLWHKDCHSRFRNPCARFFWNEDETTGEKEWAQNVDVDAYVDMDLALSSVVSNRL